MSPKPSQPEEEFFAREEVEKRHKLHEQHLRQHDTEERQKQKALHFMKCPKCGGDLKTNRISFVEVEECSDCGAMVLDKGELEKIKTADNKVLKTLIEFFRKS